MTQLSLISDKSAIFFSATISIDRILGRARAIWRVGMPSSPVNFFFTYELNCNNGALIESLKETFLCVPKYKLNSTSNCSSCLAALTLKTNFDLSLLLCWF